MKKLVLLCVLCIASAMCGFAQNLVHIVNGNNERVIDLSQVDSVTIRPKNFYGGNTSAYMPEADLIHVFGKNYAYDTIIINKNTRIDFEYDSTCEAQMKRIYSIWTFSRPVSAGNILDHMTIGWAGIMMLSDVMSNDMSLDVAGDPWGYDHQLDYYDERYIRSRQIWDFFYNIINVSNGLINKIASLTTNDLLKTYLGQALAFRGMSYFYLAQFYQHTYATSQDMPCVPLYLSNNEESIYSRATVQQVFDRAESDLLNAEELLANFKRSSKSEIDQQVAQGLLSRLYLVKREWSKAAEKARAARQGYALMDPQAVLESDYQDVTNPEVIWGVDVTTSTSRFYASFQSWMSAQSIGYGGQAGLYFRKIDKKLHSNIPTADVRRELYYQTSTLYSTCQTCTYWEIPSLANKKFKDVADFLGDYIYMRSAEMYLTEIEALVMAGKIDEAQPLFEEFMVTRNPRWSNSVTKEEVRLQRRIELWGEGFSYFDHRRWQMDMNRGYEGTNDNPNAWPLHEPNGFVPWWHFSWRFQIPLKIIQDNAYLTEADQNPIGAEGNQDPALKLEPEVENATYVKKFSAQSENKSYDDVNSENKCVAKDVKEDNAVFNVYKPILINKVTKQERNAEVKSRSKLNPLGNKIFELKSGFDSLVK